jgi:type I site-specific restriction-modification system R (restriction) subunit
LQVVIESTFAPRRFLDLVRDFIVFEDPGGSVLVKNTTRRNTRHPEPVHSAS